LDREKLLARLNLACRWLIDVAQVRNDADLAGVECKHAHDSHVGAIRGEYRAAERRWGFACPVWHTGQAVKALALAAEHVGGDALDAAGRGAQFLLNQQLPTGPDAGLLLAFEDRPDMVNSSAVLEAVDGWFTLTRVTGEAHYTDAAVKAVRWLADRADLGGGLMHDLYDPATRSRVDHWPMRPDLIGRPLLDDGSFFLAWRASGDERFRDLGLSIADRLLVDENPGGNWILYPPASIERGHIHPRHAYWWGWPMKQAFEITGNDQYRDCFLRSCLWYRHALRRDGTLLRQTYTDFTTPSFGHAMSGVGCAAIMFLDAWKLTGDHAWLNDLNNALLGCLRMQFTEAKDPNLQGAILEKVLPPKGSDASPYHLRDLGTIFFVHAVARSLSEPGIAFAPEGVTAI